MANIQIPEELFGLLCQYHLAGYTDRESEIQQQLELKLDNIIKRQLYTTYLAAESPVAKEQARLAYLSKIGIK